MGKAKSHIFIQFYTLYYIFIPKLKKTFLKSYSAKRKAHDLTQKSEITIPILNTQIIQIYSPPAWICIYIFY